MKVLKKSWFSLSGFSVFALRIVGAVVWLLWRFGLVVVRVTPAAAPVAAGGVFPLSVSFWLKPRHSFVLTLWSSDASIVNVPQRISGRAGCLALTVSVAAHKIGATEVTVTVSPTAQFGPVVQKIACMIAATFVWAAREVV